MRDPIKKPAMKPGPTMGAGATPAIGSPVHAFNGGVHERAAVASAPAHFAPDASRRNFLKAAPLGALAVVAGTPPAAAAAPLPAPAAPVQSGYHETEHIRRYYQTAAYW